jgi:hypothetical protein
MFELKWFMEWDATAPGESVYEALTGRWRWEINASGEKPFVSEVKVKGTAVWFLGMLDSWWVDGALTEVRTTVPIKPPILGADPNAWTQRSDGTWSNLAEQGFVDGRSDSHGLAEVTLFVDYNSAVYEIPLPAGSKITVPFHTVGAFWLPKLANLQIRTAGLGGVGTYHDEVGIYRVVKPQAQRAWQYVSRDGGSTFETWRTPMKLASPSVTKLPTNALIIGGKIAEIGWGYYTSQDDGLTWDEGYTLVWEAAHTDAKFVATRDGTVVSIARSGGVLWCKTSRDDYANTVRVGAVAAACELTCELSTGRLIADDGNATRFVSWDSGQSWAPVVGTVG